MYDKPPITASSNFQPDPDQVKLLADLPAAQRIRVMLEARELAVGLIRGRLRRRYPELSLSDLNLKVLEEISNAGQRTT